MAKKGKNGIFWTDTLTPMLMKTFTKYEKRVHPDSMAKVGIQVIGWVIAGSPNESRVPPVLTGALRGSGSVFVGDKFVGGTDYYPVTSGAARTMNKTYKGKNDQITIGFNTAYAGRWHEETFKPGKKSELSGDVGNKYLEKHLLADAHDMLAYYTFLYRKEMGT